MSSCATCAADNKDELETIGARALAGSISWRAAAREAGLTHHVGLKNHMEKHVVAIAEREAQDEFDALLEDAKAELLQQYALTPDASAKTLYLVALRNLEGLRDTKPSQEHLVKALKTIQELTGMKAEQKLMLQFSHAFFKQLPPPTPATPVASIEAEHYEEAELVE